MGFERGSKHCYHFRLNKDLGDMRRLHVQQACTCLQNCYKPPGTSQHNLKALPVPQLRCASLSHGLSNGCSTTGLAVVMQIEKGSSEASTSEPGTGWFLNQITVTTPEGTLWHFPCNSWIGETDADGLHCECLIQNKMPKTASVPVSQDSHCMQCSLAFVKAPWHEHGFCHF